MKFDWTTLIAPAAHLAEAALGGGTGSKKLAFVSNIIQTALLVAASAGAVAPSAATDLGTIHGSIERVVTAEKAKGNLQ
jgi:hypothetical protein